MSIGVAALALAATPLVNSANIKERKEVSSPEGMEWREMMFAAQGLEPKTCSELGWNFKPGNDGNNIQVCGQSFLNGVCYNTNSANWYMAKYACMLVGARLCSLEEVESDLVAKTGCNLDAYQVWTSQPCLEGYMVARGKFKSKDKSVCSGSLMNSYNIRCCADSTRSPTVSPTPFPSPGPTLSPTLGPTKSPTDFPTPEPTPLPSPYPTPGPTPLPSSAPTVTIVQEESLRDLKDLIDSPHLKPVATETPEEIFDPRHSETRVTLAPTKSHIIYTSANAQALTESSPQFIIIIVCSVVSCIAVTILSIKFARCGAKEQQKLMMTVTDAEWKKQLSTGQSSVPDGTVVGGNAFSLTRDFFDNAHSLETAKDPISEVLEETA